ncbi:MAG: GNAT family N-acetyltransferase [Brevirhabdus sp.]
MPTTITIRPAGAPDIASIDALLARSYPAMLKRDYPPSTLVTALPLISRAQPGLVTCGTYFVAERDGMILGAGGWTWGAPQGGGALGPRDTAHVRHVVTDHRETRQGIARRLFGTIFQTARAAGVGQLDCQSTLTAVPFYKAMGFVEIGPIEVSLRPGIRFSAVRMKRRLGAL